MALEHEIKAEWKMIAREFVTREANVTAFREFLQSRHLFQGLQLHPIRADEDMVYYRLEILSKIGNFGETFLPLLHRT